MTDRRQVLVGSLAGSLLPLSALASAAWAGEGGRPYRAIFDRTLKAGRAFAAEAAARGWAAVAIDGDVTDLWYHDLGPRWREGPAAIAGVTHGSSFFVLDHLARSAGMRVISRADLQEEAAVSWLIASPVRSRRT